MTPLWTLFLCLLLLSVAVPHSIKYPPKTLCLCLCLCLCLDSRYSSLSLQFLFKMVSKRQILARKQYKEAHPEQFPTPEPTPAKDPEKKKKKRSNFKRKKEGPKESKYPNDTKNKRIRKHPLRIPGMRPGESCYICKAKDHIAKLCPQKAQWEKHMVRFCFDFNYFFFNFEYFEFFFF